VKNITKTSLALFAMTGLLIAGKLSFAQVSDHTYTSESIQTGSRVYVRHCALCHGPDGAWVEGINLARGRFHEAVTDEDLRRAILNGAADGRMPPINLSDSDLTGIIAYIRTGFEPEGSAVAIGNVLRGRSLFEGKGECTACHRVNGRGPRTAPDLSDVGAIRTPGALQRSLIAPATALLPINRAVTIVTRDGETITGRRLNEDTYTVQLIDAEERLRSLVKRDLVSYRLSETPTHEPSVLSGDEVADLIAYLLALRGQL
jgi:putative heme-binding domain-containing protein|tara:strand:- start:2042 stop:2821 length:780 start_codon:yes stop_codon:yes gene_type:complete